MGPGMALQSCSEFRQDGAGLFTFTQVCLYWIWALPGRRLTGQGSFLHLRSSSRMSGNWRLSSGSLSNSREKSFLIPKDPSEPSHYLPHTLLLNLQGFCWSVDYKHFFDTLFSCQTITHINLPIEKGQKQLLSQNDQEMTSEKTPRSCLDTQGTHLKTYEMKTWPIVQNQLKNLENKTKQNFKQILGLHT